jgi:hypothetical protein
VIDARAATLIPRVMCNVSGADDVTASAVPEIVLKDKGNGGGETKQGPQKSEVGSMLCVHWLGRTSLYTDRHGRPEESGQIQISQLVARAHD